MQGKLETSPSVDYYSKDVGETGMTGKAVDVVHDRQLNFYSGIKTMFHPIPKLCRRKWRQILSSDLPKNLPVGEI